MNSIRTFDRGLLQPNRQMMVSQTIIAFDDSCRICQSICAGFADLCRSMHPELGKLLAPQALQSCEMKDLTVNIKDWQDFAATDIKPIVRKGKHGQRLPALTLVLASTRLSNEDSRPEFLNQVAAAADGISSIQLFLIDPVGNSPLWDGDFRSRLQSELAETLSGTAASVCLVAPVNAEGELFAANDVVHLVSHAMFATLVLDQNTVATKAKPAIVMQTLAGGGWLSTTDAVAEQLCPRLYSRILAIELTDRQDDGADEVLTKPMEMLAWAVDADLPFGAKPIIAQGETRRGADHKMASLLDFDSRFTLTMIHLEKAARIDGLPDRLKSKRLEELDELASNEQVEAVSRLVIERFADRSRQVQERVRQALAGSFFRTKFNMAELRVELLEQLAKQRCIRLKQGEQIPLKQAVHQLESAIKQKRNAIHIMLLLGAISFLAAAGLAFWGLTFGPLFLSLLAAVIFAVGLGIGGIRCWLANRGVQFAQHRSIESIQRRCQYIFCSQLYQALQNHFDALESLVRNGSALLERATDSLVTERKSTCYSAVTPPRRCFRVPAVEEPLLKESASLFVDQDHELLRATDSVRQFFVQLALEILSDKTPAEAAAGRIKAFITEALRNQYAHGFEIWRFFAADRSASSLEEAKLKAAVTACHHQIPFAGGDVTTAGGDRQTYWFAPAAIESRIESWSGSCTILFANDRLVRIDVDPLEVNATGSQADPFTTRKKADL